ncbi:hypothetical protein ACFQ5D_06405 [Paenibacillus farraposensis]|uniref:Phage protein n=1 Tax=Paenibacillus farraposensis TaxID=2807095 RepID=A0ABW4DDK7_9BACL|nr:hypothetical protein [Paenibacillus farraposensis]
MKTTKKLRDYLDDELAKFKQEVLSGNYIPPSKFTFKDFYENEWAPKDAEPKLKRTNEATEDYVDMPQWYMDELAKHIKAMRKAKLEAKALGVWQGRDRNFVFHAGTGKPYYHTTSTQSWKSWCE